MTRGPDLSVEIPQGYVPLPLTGIDSSIAAASALLHEVGPADLMPAADQMLPALGMFLDELAGDGVRYCGLGRHAAGDIVVSSVLTVLAYDTGGDSENPRVVLKNLAEAKLADGGHGDLEMIDLDNRPMMFFEQVRDLPVPDLPGNPIEGNTASVYQLEVVVPADDGSAIASIELSTMFIAQGPQFRRMIIDMARSVDLKYYKPQGSSLTL